MRAARPARTHGDGGGRSAYLYTREAEQNGSTFHARMFWEGREDPATGSAAAAFAGVVQAFDRPGDGEHTLTIEQGFEMGRPSLIALSVTIEAGVLAAATIGGSVVVVSSGSLDL
jgi:trans-2,3-dihydro-3-hydroxyanthranilate isomerase